MSELAAYVVYCRDLGYLSRDMRYWTSIAASRPFYRFDDAEQIAFEAAFREPHLIGDIGVVVCYVDHWGAPCHLSFP